MDWLGYPFICNLTGGSNGLLGYKNLERSSICVKNVLPCLIIAEAEALERSCDPILSTPSKLGPSPSELD